MGLKIGSKTKLAKRMFTPQTIKELKDKIAKTKQNGESWECDLRDLDVTEIEDWLFEGCSGLEIIVLPESLIKIGKGALSGCTSLERVEIPKEVIKIGCNAFEGCKKLEEVTLPIGVNAALDCVFENCDALKTIHIIR